MTNPNVQPLRRSDDLVTVLEDLGIEVRSTHGDEVNGRCPVHRRFKGRESTRYSWYLNTDTGLWICHTCGARGNLSQLISDLSPDPAALWKVQSHLITNGLRRLNAEEAVYDPDVTEEVDWVRYAKFAPLPRAVLLHRKFDPEVAERYGVRWDDSINATIVPILSPLGELRGWQAKKEGWVRNVPTGVHKGTTLFGIERAFATTAVLVESPLDVVRFHSAYAGAHISCVSSFGANVSREQCKMLSQFDRVVVALDNDAAGKLETLRLRIKNLITPRHGLRYWYYGQSKNKDIGEMESDEILFGLEVTTRVPR